MVSEMLAGADRAAFRAHATGALGNTGGVSGAWGLSERPARSAGWGWTCWSTRWSRSSGPAS